MEDFNEDVRVRGNDRAAASGASPRAARSGGSFKAPKARERRPSAVDRLLDAAGQVTRRGTILRASDHYAPDTLFQLVPQYPREGVIGMEMHLRVRHVVSGMWLHIDIAPTDELTPAQKARVEEERALKTELLLRRGVRGGASPTAGMIISGLGKVSEEAGLPPTEAAGSPKPGLKPTSHFGLRKVAGGGGSGMGTIGKALQGSAAKEQVLAADETEAATLCDGGCSPRWRRLQP